MLPELPTANYLTPQEAHIRHNETMLLGMHGLGVTDASSPVTVLGSTAFNPCAVLMAYNQDKKTAAIYHTPWPNPEDLERVVTAIRSDLSDSVNIHIVGNPVTEAPNDVMNSMRLYGLEKLVNTCAALPNCELSTLDVYDRPKPYAVAIDAKSGNLIKGSELFRTEEEAEQAMVKNNHVDAFMHWNMTDYEEKPFDGRALAGAAKGVAQQISSTMNLSPSLTASDKTKPAPAPTTQKHWER